MACAPGPQQHAHQQPKDRHEEKGLRPHDAGETPTDKSVEYPSGRRFVLIRSEKARVETSHAEDGDGRSVTGKLVHTYRSEHEERPRHHATVDTDERIGIVELHHQIGGEDETEQVDP